jgi:hypothetical protein
MSMALTTPSLDATQVMLAWETPVRSTLAQISLQNDGLSLAGRCVR